MRKARTLAVSLSVGFMLVLTISSAHADNLRADDARAKVNDFEEHHLNLPEQSRAGLVHSFSETFANNNGKHLGFSVASTNRGNKFGLFKSPPSGGTPGGTVGSDAIPNPEPAAVFLLGTGLAAVGAYARRRFRKSKH